MICTHLQWKRSVWLLQREEQVQTTLLKGGFLLELSCDSGTQMLSFSLSKSKKNCIVLQAGFGEWPRKIKTLFWVQSIVGWCPELKQFSYDSFRKSDADTLYIFNLSKKLTNRQQKGLQRLIVYFKGRHIRRVGSSPKSDVIEARPPAGSDIVESEASVQQLMGFWHKRQRVWCCTEHRRCHLHL